MMHNIRSRSTNKLKYANEMTCYMILVVPIIGFLAFILYPYIWAAKWSFFDYTGVASKTQFVGTRNFADIFTKDSTYWASWITTIKFALLKLPLEIPLALILAAVLQKDSLKFKGFFRSAYYLPCIISVAIVGVIFSNMFDYRGVINNLLRVFSVIDEPIDWFTDYSSSMTVLVLASVWQTFGTNVLYFMAALANVPPELYEAADIEGAGTFKKFLMITVPMIAPVFQVILLLAINGTLHIGEFIIVLSNGAPSGSTYTVGAYLINAFVPGFATGTPNIGYGSALSIITSVIYCIIAIVYMKLSDRMSEVY